MDVEQLSRHLQPAGLTMFVFGLLTWLYVVTIQITRPEWLPSPLAHYDIAPFNWRLDDIGILSFAIAAFGFFLWRHENQQERASRRGR